MNRTARHLVCALALAAALVPAAANARPPRHGPWGRPAPAYHHHHHHHGGSGWFWGSLGLAVGSAIIYDALTDPAPVVVRQQPVYVPQPVQPVVVQPPVYYTVPMDTAAQRAGVVVQTATPAATTTVSAP